MSDEKTPDVEPAPDASLYTGGPGENFLPHGGGNSDAGAALEQAEAPYAAFQEARWSRVADEDEIARLREEHANLSREEQVAEGKRLAALSDADLTAALDEGKTAVTAPTDYSGTIAEVLEKVGDDPAKAAEALAYEQENKGRATLLASLAEIADSHSGVGSEGSEDDSEDDES